MKSVNKLMILLITLIGFVSCVEEDNNNTSDSYSSEATTEVTTESINSGSSSTSSNSNSTYHTITTHEADRAATNTGTSPAIRRTDSTKSEKSTRRTIWVTLKS